MAATDTLLRPKTCALLLVDFQAGLGFGVARVSPCDGKEDWGIEQDVEVERIVGVLVEIADIGHHPAPDALLHAHFNLVAPGGGIMYSS